MSAAEVKKLVSQVNGAVSEEEALQIIKTERDARADEIRAVASGSRRDRRSRGSAQHIGGLLRFEVDDLLDVAPEKQIRDLRADQGAARPPRSSSSARAEREWDLTPPADVGRGPDAVETAAAA